MALVTALAGCEQKTQAQKDMEACKDRFSAHYMAKQFVTARLRAPKTAEFPSQSEVLIVPLGGCSHSVSGYVDSQNGFGALIRTRYTAIVKSTGGDKWVLEDLSIGK